MRYGFIAALALTLALGCGQKGNLYLRDDPPPGVRPAKAEPYKPVPYPSQPRDESEPDKK
jgi:predicted small lipoprotein YifL